MFEMVAEVDEDGRDDGGGDERQDADAVVWKWWVLWGGLARHVVRRRRLKDMCGGPEVRREESLLLSRSCFLLGGCVDALGVVETSCYKRC